jgi:hypothetical protein
LGILVPFLTVVLTSASFCSLWRKATGTQKDLKGGGPINRAGRIRIGTVGQRARWEGVMG